MNPKDEDQELCLPKYSILDNKYRILYQIGDGQFAKVKLSEDIETGELVAVKIFKNKQMDSCEKLERFMEEVRMLFQCHHQNIVEIIAASICGTFHKLDSTIKHVSYIVLKYAKFGEIYRLINITGKFSESIARALFIQIIDGLEYLQGQNICHRDLKTENLLIDEECTLRIADFGCATSTRDVLTMLPIHFNTAVRVGSLEYNAPEINMDESYCGEEADIFSLGVCLFLMVVGYSPFRMADVQDPYYRCLMKPDKTRFWKIFNDIPISDQFKDLFNRMTERKANRRISVTEIRCHPWMEGTIASEGDLHQECADRFRGLEEEAHIEMRGNTQRSLNSSNSDDTRPITPLIKDLNNREETTYYKMRVEYGEECADLNKRIQIRNGESFHIECQCLPAKCFEGLENWPLETGGEIDGGEIREEGLNPQCLLALNSTIIPHVLSDDIRGKKSRIPHTLGTTTSLQPEEEKKGTEEDPEAAKFGVILQRVRSANSQYSPMGKARKGDCEDE